MSQSDPTPADPHQEIAPAAPEEQFKQTMTAFGKLVERIAPWLFELGSWIFGGLIAVNLLIMASLITVGPGDPAIRVSTAAFALALPLDLAGLVLLRLVQDMKRVGFEAEVAQAFQDGGFAGAEQAIALTALEVWPRRRTVIVLGYALGILALSVLLTLTGMIAALWHMAWWIGVAFFAMVLISQGMVIVAIVTAPPPRSAAEQERTKRDTEEIIRQAKAQAPDNINAE